MNQLATQNLTVLHFSVGSCDRAQIFEKLLHKQIDLATDNNKAVENNATDLKRHPPYSTVVPVTTEKQNGSQAASFVSANARTISINPLNLRPTVDTKFCVAGVGIRNRGVTDENSKFPL